MREKNAVIDLNIVTASHAPGRAGKVAEAIHRDTDCLVEFGNQKSRGEMREVMFDVMDACFDGFAWKSLLQGDLETGGFANVFHPVENQSDIGPVRDDKGEAAQVVDAGFAIHRDVIEVANREAGLLQTELDGSNRQAGPMFHATKTLFFGGGDNYSVPHEAGRKIAVIGIETQDGHE